MKSKFQISPDKFHTNFGNFYSEATETRHALHGVRWPASNPKCLHVDFGRETDMEKAIMSTLEETVTRTITNEMATREPESANSFGWSKADALRSEQEEKSKVLFSFCLNYPF